MNRVQELLAEIADLLPEDIDVLEGFGAAAASVIESLELIQRQIRELQKIATVKP